VTFASGLTTTRDRIRLIVGDTSNDVATEIFPDATYDAVIAQYDGWKYAAADMADAVAVQLDRKVSAFTATGDMSVQYSDQAKTLRAKAIALRKEADTEAAAETGSYGKVVTITSAFLTGGDDGWEWS